jgi:uncharacterized membrane protein YraQ (UPF0718 family)
VTQYDLIKFIIDFLGIVWEALPFIIVGAIIAGILEDVLPQEALGKILPKNVIPAVMIGGALGLIYPMCECGIVVVMRRLLRKGLPLSSCVAYMLAGPIVNVIVLGSTAVAFVGHRIDDGTSDGASLGPTMVGLRAGLGYLVACVTGFVVHALDKRSKRADLLKLSALPSTPTVSLGMVEPAKPEPKKTIRQRLNNISATALNDFIDITVFLIIGSAIAAIVKMPMWNLEGKIEVISREQPLFAIPLMMGLAFILCLCSEADAFLAASFTKMSVSAKMAFLVFGPMLDIKLLLMYTRVFRPKLIAVIVTTVSVQVLVYTTFLHQVYNPSPYGSGSAQPVVIETQAPTPATAPTDTK